MTLPIQSVRNFFEFYKPFMRKSFPPVVPALHFGYYVRTSVPPMHRCAYAIEESDIPTGAPRARRATDVRSRCDTPSFSSTAIAHAWRRARYGIHPSDALSSPHVPGTRRPPRSPHRHVLPNPRPSRHRSHRHQRPRSSRCQCARQATSTPRQCSTYSTVPWPWNSTGDTIRRAVPSASAPRCLRRFTRAPRSWSRGGILGRHTLSTCRARQRVTCGTLDATLGARGTGIGKTRCAVSGARRIRIQEAQARLPRVPRRALRWGPSILSVLF